MSQLLYSINLRMLAVSELPLIRDLEPPRPARCHRSSASLAARPVSREGLELDEIGEFAGQQIEDQRLELRIIDDLADHDRSRRVEELEPFLLDRLDQILE